MKAKGLDEIFGSNFPSVSTVSKELKEYRRKDEARSPELKGLDEPWSITALKYYPLPPEALPFVIQSWVYTREILDLEFTIRDAQWVARLYAVYKHKNIQELAHEAHFFADNELLSEFTELTLPQIVENVHTLSIYQEYIGERVTKKRHKKILEEKQFAPSSIASEEFGRDFKIVQEWVEAHTEEYLDKVYENEATKEAKNERTHNKER